MNQQHVEVVRHPPADAQALWSPVVGAETTALVQKALPDETSRARLLTESRGILARCVPPSGDVVVPRTGLIIGYVQSGKTLSFTTITALARDNGFPLVILLAGTKTVLHGQTSDRLSEDLEVLRDGGMSPWTLVNNPDATPAAASQLATWIKTTLDPTTPAKFRRTTVITVMKNTTRVDNLRGLLALLPAHGIDTSTLPIIVIDDEADQAGMNAGRRKEGVKEETATYASILGLRKAAPNASYLMYTATPQAPLLISIADALSPDFVNVLTPGSAYTGGRYFFEERVNEFVTLMSDDEVTRALDAAAVEPPESLESALATFYLVKAIFDDHEMVSMLVHPSHGTELHTLYGSFVTQLKESWQNLLKSPGPDRDELIDTYFRPAYDEVVKRADREVPTLDELLAEIPHWMVATQIRVINSDPTNADDLQWKSAPAWIVIGGNKLDRGFTIEGLAVTYMPRGTGVGNADTIQQRARFFGYKKSYGDLCRAWLPVSLADAYESYVRHEEHLRGEMLKIESSGDSLRTWTRRMLLDPVFKATRRAVIEIPILHNRFRGGTWTSVDRIAGLESSKSAANEAALVNLRLEFGAQAEVDDRDPRGRNQRFSVPLSVLLDRLLVDWKGHSEDVVTLQQLCLVLQAHVDDQPDLEAKVFLMDGLDKRQRSRSKTDPRAVTLQQGHNPQGGYPGDKAFFADDQFSVQVHHVVNKDGDGEAWQALGLSLRIPQSLAGAAIFQYEPEDDE